MEFIENAVIPRAESRMENALDFAVFFPARYPSQPDQQPARIGIDDERGLPVRVQENRVRGLLPYSPDREKLFPGRRLSRHGRGACPYRLQGHELSGFLIEVTRGSDQPAQAFAAAGEESFWAFDAGAGHVAERGFHVGPRGILRQNGSHDDFHPAPRRSRLRVVPGVVAAFVEARGVCH